MAEVELQQIGAHTVIDLLQTSSTYTLYKSRYKRNKEIQIKRFHTPLSTIEARTAFLARVRQLKKLKNRNIANMVDADFDGDYPYIAFEAIYGQPLNERFPVGQQLPTSEIRLLLSQVAGAIQYVHVTSCLHGNLHPGSLIFEKQTTILLTDFALLIPELDDLTLAVPYMAPEYLAGEPTLASDQYALGIMVYEWLCGRRPYEATERDSLRHQQENQPLAPLREWNPHISEAVEQVVLRALALDPDQRYPHTQDLADQYIRALAGFPIQAIPTISRARIPDTPPVTPVQEHQEPEQKPVETLTKQPQVISTPQPTPARQDEVSITRRLVYSDTMPEEERKEARKIAFMDDDEDEALFPEEFEGGLNSAKSSRLQNLIQKDLCQGGVLSKRLPGYEERPAQIEMARLVARSLTERTPAIIEAGTGTGKSLAYLVPAVRSNKVAIISTANKALQEQLFYKDIPFVQKHIKHFEAALVKGVNNYVCLDRMEAERVGFQFFTKNNDFQRLLDVINDEEADFSGDFETLGFQLAADVRGRISADSDQCAWSKCNFYADCYVRMMRERATKAQVIVVNHTLLLLDAVMDGFLLPERDVIILDEAHHLEEEATRSFTITVNPNRIQTLLAQRTLKDHSTLSLQDEAMRSSQKLWAHLEMLMERSNSKGRHNLEFPVEEGLHLANVIKDLGASLHSQRPKDLPDKEAQLYDKLHKRTTNLAAELQTVFEVENTKQFVYYLERIESSSSRSGIQIQASAAPLDVTSWLKERLFNKCNVICTSATLATVSPNPVNPADKGPNFAYFRRRVGLPVEERPEVMERILPLAFDYENHALLYLPRHLPQPAFGAGSDDYMKSIAREMYRLVRLSKGRAFLLFSSKRMMDRAYELMSPHLNYPLLKQGDMSRMELTRRFRQEEGAILFGLKSFWEGVDIAGDALSLVVIDKLPFDPPDDPVHEARVEQMKAAGENWFGTYVLPQAVLRLKQGLGRLLRTREDRGVMAILDTRLHTKGYGKLVLNALPPARQTSNIRDVERFFTQPTQ